MVAALIHFALLFVVLPTFMRDRVPRVALGHLMETVLFIVEPLLPAVMVFIKSIALVRLKRQGILVGDSQKMLIAGQLDVVLFDKTGTLTSEQVFVTRPLMHACSNSAPT